MIPKTKILLDTNVLIYLSQAESEYKIKDLKLLHNSQLFIVDRSLLEFYRVFTGSLKQSIEDTLKVIEFYQDNPNYNILTATKFSNQLTFKLAKENKAKSGKIFDLDILAIAIENEIDIIYTKNVKDFAINTSVKIIDPFIAN